MLAAALAGACLASEPTDGDEPAADDPVDVAAAERAGAAPGCGAGGAPCGDAIVATAIPRGFIYTSPAPVYPGATVGYAVVSWNAFDVASAYMTGTGCNGFGLTGSAACPLAVGQTGFYYLYGDGRLLATATAVGVRVTGTISANPTELTLQPGVLGTTTITWSTVAAPSATVWVSVDGATATAFASATASTRAAPWIQAGHSYKFTLRAGTTSGGPALGAVTVTGRAPALAIDPEGGLWWNPARSGTGWHLYPFGDTLAITWLTYAGSTPVWYLGYLTRQPGQWVGTLERYTWNGASATGATVGAATVTLASPTAATVAWSLGSLAGTESIQRYVFGGAGSAPSLSGVWYAASEPGWGALFESQGTTHVGYLLVYDAAGQPTWVGGAASGVGPTIGFGLYGTTGTNLCPGCVGAPSTSTWPAGSMSVDVGTVGSGAMPLVLDAQLGNGTWNRNVTLNRL